MFIPSVSSHLMTVLPLATGTTAHATPDATATIASSEINEYTNNNNNNNTTTTISTDNRTSSSGGGGLNALGMLLFWVFLVSTVFLVLGSLAVLRRLKRRDAKRLQETKDKEMELEQKAAKAAVGGGGYYGSDGAAAKETDADEATTIGGLTIASTRTRASKEAVGAV